MKNSEWGAVAYLTHSSYGRNGKEVDINDDGYVAASGGEGTSSTGNETGIYDLSGAAYEYVAAFNDAYSSTGEYYSTTDTIYCSSTGKNMGATGLENSESTKYLTAYKNSMGYVYVGQSMNFNDYAFFENAGEKVSIVGDGLKEIHASGYFGWKNDTSQFVSCNTPFFSRGGSCVDGAHAGVFCSFSNAGFAYNNDGSFRVVCPL